MEKTYEEYGSWLIWYDPLPGEWRGADWRYMRKSANSDIDVGHAESKEMCLQSIDFLEEQFPVDEPETPKLRSIEFFKSQSDEFLDNFLNIPLINQLGLGLQAAISILACNGRGFADGVLRQQVDVANAAYLKWKSLSTEIIPEKKKLQLEVGKSYRTRSGSVISISSVLENTTSYYANGYRFSGGLCGQCYTDEGFTYTDGTENPGDLIEEVI